MAPQAQLCHLPALAISPATTQLSQAGGTPSSSCSPEAYSSSPDVFGGIHLAHREQQLQGVGHSCTQPGDADNTQGHCEHCTNLSRPTLAGEAADVEVVALDTHHLALAGVPAAVALDDGGATPGGVGVLLVGNCWQEGGKEKWEEKGLLAFGTQPGQASRH